MQLCAAVEEKQWQKKDTSTEDDEWIVEWKAQEEVMNSAFFWFVERVSFSSPSSPTIVMTAVREPFGFGVYHSEFTAHYLWLLVLV